MDNEANELKLIKTLVNHDSLINRPILEAITALPLIGLLPYVNSMFHLRRALSTGFYHKGENLDPERHIQVLVETAWYILRNDTHLRFHFLEKTASTERGFYGIDYYESDEWKRGDILERMLIDNLCACARRAFIERLGKFSKLIDNNHSLTDSIATHKKILTEYYIDPKGGNRKMQYPTDEENILGKDSHYNYGVEAKSVALFENHVIVSLQPQYISLSIPILISTLLWLSAQVKWLGENKIHYYDVDDDSWIFYLLIPLPDALCAAFKDNKENELAWKAVAKKTRALLKSHELGRIILKAK